MNKSFEQPRFRTLANGELLPVASGLIWLQSVPPWGLFRHS